MITTSVERTAASQVKLTVTVPAEDVDAAISATYKRLSSKYKLPGFRPGKAPRPILDQQLGREFILSEATEQVINDSYSKALDAEGLRPIESPELEEIETIVAGEAYTYTAEIDVRPELTISSAKDFAVEVPEREATQAEIDLHVNAARDRFATLEPVEGRGVEPDDFVLISFVGTVDGEGYDGNEVDKYLYEMGRGLMPAEFDSGIVGAKAGDERHIEFDIPDTTSNPDFVGKTAGFDVTVHEIKAKQLPALDDEFATNMGGFETVADMVADLKGRIDLQKGTAADREKERRLREQLAQRLEGDVPEAMVVSRQSNMMRDFLQMLESREIGIDQYLASSGVDMDTLEADVKVQSEQSVREDLALEALFRELGFEVTDEDIDEEIAAIGQATDSTPEEARKRWEEMGLMAVMREQIMHRKAVFWLMDNSTETTEPTPSDEGGEAEAGTKKKSAPKKKAAKESAETAPAEDAAPVEDSEE